MNSEEGSAEKHRLQTALASLPHGPEFRFLDRILTLVPGRSASAEYDVRGDEPYLRGHFPGQPLFPGVLLVEGAAQLAGIVVQCDPADRPASGLRLAALRAVKILGTARPGETICFHATLVQRLGSLAHAEASALVGDRVILRAQLTLSAEAEL